MNERKKVYCGECECFDNKKILDKITDKQNYQIKNFHFISREKIADGKCHLTNVYLNKWKFDYCFQGIPKKKLLKENQNENKK